ncbi:YbaB/EbfC family nucleoid-associated protein [Peptococcaceae bacterium 1198_IL3148]
MLGGANMNKMMKQVQKMQQDMAKMQEELANRTVEATAGGGVVKVVANGRNELVSIEINPEAVDPGDVEMLQDLVLAAVNESLRKSQELVSSEMSKITGGLKIPGLF